LRTIIYISLFFLFSNCTKQNTFSFPVGEYSLLWIPENEDSVKFIDDFFIAEPELTRGGRLNYLSYATLSSSFQGRDSKIEVITQRAVCTDGSFELNYTLVAGIPQSNEANGHPQKTDILQIDNGSNQHEMFISKNQITTSLYVLDTVSLNEKTYINVLTDSSTFFFSQKEGVISFYNGSKWYYKN